MSNSIEKAYFIRNKFIRLISNISPEQKPSWGKMNPQQMVEHMSDAFRQANGNILYTEVVNPPEVVAKMQAFLETDKPFRENTPNKMLPDEPVPTKNESFNAAIIELEQEIKDFFGAFKSSPDKKILNPLFGELNYEQWVQLLYKHCWHHLRQFGVTGDS